MAAYTHFEVADSDLAWESQFGFAYTATASTITWINDDASISKALGSFVISQGKLVSGIISTLERTNDGITITESITGLALDAKTFVSTPYADQKWALATAGADILNGFSGNDNLYGGAQNEHVEAWLLAHS